MREYKLDGFTLQELLIVLIIIGVLMLLALPNLIPLVSKAKSLEAQLQLRHIYTLQQHYHQIHGSYTESLGELGFEQERLKTDQGDALYRIDVLEAGQGGFVAHAIAVIDFDRDGDFNTWQIDQDKDLKEIIPE